MIQDLLSVNNMQNTHWLTDSCSTVTVARRIKKIRYKDMSMKYFASIYVIRDL